MGFDWMVMGGLALSDIFSLKFLKLESNDLVYFGVSLPTIL